LGRTDKLEKYRPLKACLVHARDDYKFHYGNTRGSDVDVAFTTDHVPLSHDGGEELEILFCCCAPCNGAELNNSKQYPEWLKRKARGD